MRKFFRFVILLGFASAFVTAVRKHLAPSQPEDGPAITPAEPQDRYAEPPASEGAGPTEEPAPAEQPATESSDAREE